MATPQITILGTGIIGLSTAYFLSVSPTTPPFSIHLVDPSSILFASASGLAGGFLAEDWFAEECEELGRLSFRLHKQLAEENGGKEKWGYVESRGVSYSAGKEEKGRKERGEDWLRAGGSRGDIAGVSEGFSEDGVGPAWLMRGEGDSMESIGKEGSLAQMYQILPVH